MILKLKRTPGIYLVGFMGSGKTTVGRDLAGELGWRFIDVDDDIEARAAASIIEIFEKQGESTFRTLEAEAIALRVKEIEGGHPTVMALGGGAFAQERNFTLVSRNGVSIWLDCPLDEIEQRITKETHRPLARDPEQFVALYSSRLDSYRRADFRVDASLGPRPILEQILKLPIF